MVDFTAAEFREIMDRKRNIRNISVIGHLSHGKSTLTNSLVAAAGTIRHECSVALPMTHTCANEADPDISIRSTGISLLFEMNSDSLETYKGIRDGNTYIVNLIDSPGHVDLSAEATAALRITDGALLVIDSVEGVCVQTEIVLHQAISESVWPVLCLNKMDKLFSGLQVGGAKLEFTGEQTYKILFNIVENLKAIIAARGSKVSIHPENGDVAFSSGLHGWAFTLTGFARKYASMHGVDESKVAERLWGDHFYDPALNKWLDKYNGSKECTRGFVKLCYDPIKKIMKACMDEDKGKLWGLCRKLGVRLSDDDKKLLGEDLFNSVMQTWLPASTALFEMMIFHLPSPLQAQQHRVKNLYLGPRGDAYEKAIWNCDPDGPLMLYVSKMIPTSNAGRFFAFGRIFSGRIRTGMKVRIIGRPSMKNDVKRVLRTIVWMGKKQHEIDDVPCGNTVGLIGFDEWITKSATLTGEMEVDAWPIRAMKLPVPHVMFVTVKCKVPSNALQLHDGLKRLMKWDLAVLCRIGESSSFMVAGVGEFHLEICLKYLEAIMNGVEVTVSSPIVSYRETVLDKSSNAVETISGNKLNSLSIVARPLSDELVKAIDNGLLSPYANPMARSEIFAKYGWDELKIWCFGPEAVGPNMVVDMCKGIEHPELAKQLIEAGFKLASKEGALAKENMRGICFEVHDVNIHAGDASRAISGKSGNLNQMVKKAFCDAQLAAKPRLLEPVYIVMIQCPESALHVVNGILNQRGIYQCEHFATEETMLFNLRAYASVCDSFGLVKAIRAATSGQVTAHCVFGYWDDMSCSPTQASTPAGQRVLEIRQRKNMEKPSFQK